MADSRSLRLIADQIAGEAAGRRGIIRDARQVDVSKWGMPQDTHLLRSPMAWRDDVVAHFADAGAMRGDPLPADKAKDKIRFRPSETTLWIGYNKSYKSTFINELITFWACSGIGCALASLEMPAVTLLAKSVQQATALERPAPSDVDRALEAMAASLTIYDVAGRVPVKNVLAVMHYCAVELQARHFVLDNLTALLSVSNDEAGPFQQFVADVVTIARVTGMHIHLVAHCNKPKGGDETIIPGRYDARGTGAASDLVDNVLIVWRNIRKEDAWDDDAMTEELRQQGDILVKIDAQRHFDYRGTLKFWIDRRCVRFNPFGNMGAAPFL